MTKMFNPSPQQRDFFNWVSNGSGSCVLEAVAGSGKTTTLLQSLRLMRGSVFFGAYNKSVSLEITEKVKDDLSLDQSKIKVGTMHSAGFSNFRYHNKGVEVDDKKVFTIWCSILDSIKDEDERMRHHGMSSALIKTVSIAKQRALGVIGKIEDKSQWESIIEHFAIDSDLPEDIEPIELMRMSCRVLKESISLNSRIIDFNDMIYAPLIEDTPMYKVDWVLVDEAQDTNPARRELAAKMLKPNGRLVAVGDRAQALYAFTGADSNALDLISKRFSATRLPLTVSYRCPKVVVEEAKNFVNHIESHEDSSEGTKREIVETELLDQGLGSKDVILCRFNKPLIDLAIQLTRKGVKLKIEGMDLSRALMNAIDKTKAVTIAELTQRLYLMKDSEKERLKGEGKEYKFAEIEDRIDSILSVSSAVASKGGRSVSEVKQAIASLFADNHSGSLTLSSVHKAKGKEWDRVFILGHNKFMPCKLAKLPWEKEVEKFIQYVAVTRSKRELVYVSVGGKE